MASSAAPNQSLYLQNLPEKLQKEDLRRELYMLFSPFGPVLDIIALKTPKMRGQAHVLFRNVGDATQALRSREGFDFYGREMRISYSKNRSNTLAKLTGTVNQPVEQNSTPTAPPPSAFPAPPGAAPPSTLPAPPSGLPPPPGLPRPNGPTPTLKAPERAAEDVASPSGTKRGREESDDEEAAMEEDEEEEMEMSEEDD